jgi:hypothetical protein
MEVPTLAKLAEFCLDFAPMDALKPILHKLVSQSFKLTCDLFHEWTKEEVHQQTLRPFLR